MANYGYPEPFDEKLTRSYSLFGFCTNTQKAGSLNSGVTAPGVDSFARTTSRLPASVKECGCPIFDTSLVVKA